MIVEGAVSVGIVSIGSWGLAFWSPLTLTKRLRHEQNTRMHAAVKASEVFALLSR